MKLGVAGGLCVVLAGAVVASGDAPRQTKTGLGYDPGSAWSESVTEANADLTGSGHLDHIVLSPVARPRGDPEQVLVTVNGTIKAALEGNQYSDFYLAAVDRRDRHKEIVVETHEDSDEMEYQLLWFDGRRLIAMGTIGDSPHYRGDGTLTADTWNGFWFSTDTYVPRRDHTLRLVPRRFYPVDKTSYVSHPLALHRRPDDAVVLAIVPVNHGVRLLDANKDLRYRVRTADGVRGWIDQDQACRDLDFPCLP